MTQASQTTPTATTAPGAATSAQTATSTNTVTTGQLTYRDIEALRARRTELGEQLRSATSRRREVQQSLRGAVGADKAGLEDRLAGLDKRIVRIEADIEENGRQLSSPEAVRVVSSDPPRRNANNMSGDNMVPIAICFVLFVLSPIAFSFSRMMWKRTNNQKASASPESNDRMIRMEQAIDSIAIEIERVSEGQRFVTRLLAEGKTPAQLGVAQPAAQPVAVASDRFGVSR